ncbi:MAG: autotransporter-associated beta strand repeat-containing protein [Pirellulales bacterium]
MSFTGAGAVLELADDAGLIFGRNTIVSANSQITVDRLTAGAGVTHTLGTLLIGGQTLTVAGGANVTSGTAALTFGSVTATTGPATFTVNNPTGGGTTLLTFGAMTNGAFAVTFNGNGQVAQTSVWGNGAGAIVYSGTGTLTLNQANTLTGALTINSGNVVGTIAAGALGAGTVILNGGALRLTNASGTNLSFNRNTTVSGSATVVSDVAAAGAGNTYTLGTLRIGNQTLTVQGGANVTSGTAGITFGATTLLDNAAFDVQNPTAGGATTLTLGALGDLATARTLTFRNTGTATTASNVVLATAAGALTDGTTVNIESGTNAGVVVSLNIAAALGTLAQVNVNGNSTLAITAAQTINSLSGTGTVVANGAAAQTLTIGNGASGLAPVTTFSGALNNGTQTLNVVKAGNGTLILSGSNSFTGSLTVSGGILRIGSTSAITASSGITVNTIGVLDANGLTISRPLTVSTAGPNGTGAIIDSTGLGVTFTGATALGAASVIGLNTDITFNNGTGLTGNFTLNKIGSGTLTIADSATTSARTGVNYVSAGTLRLQSSSATSITPIGTGAFAMNGGTLSLGFDIANNSNTGAVNVLANSTIVTDRNSAGAGVNITLGGLNIGGSTLTVRGGTTATSGTTTLTLGTVTIGGAGLAGGNPTIDVQSGAVATALTLGALTDQGNAARTITFRNTGTSTTNSTVTLGTAATSLLDGTSIVINGGANAGVNVSVTNATSIGALSQVTVNGNSTLTLGAAQTWGSLSGNGTVGAVTFALTLGNSVNSQAYNTDFSGAITGTTATLIKNSISTQTLSGTTANTFTGLTTVNTGTLVLNKTGVLALGGSLTIGAAGGANGLATVRLDKSNQIVTTATLILNSGATLNLNASNQTIGTFNAMTGATISGSGTLTLGGGTATLTALGNSVISAGVLFGGGTRTLATTAAQDSLTIGGAIGSDATALTKTGAGTVVLSGNNAYAGLTTVSAGIVNIRHANALGTTAAGTTVAAGATLQIQGGITTAAEALTLNGAARRCSLVLLSTSPIRTTMPGRSRSPPPRRFRPIPARSI